MITDPRFAPQRSDLPFLRRRSRPHAATTAAPHAGAQPAISFDRPGRQAAAHAVPVPGPAGRAPAPAPAVPVAPAGPARPVAGNSLDLGAPAAVAPAVSARSVAGSSSSLDLDAPAAVAPTGAPAPGPPPAAPVPSAGLTSGGASRRVRSDPRVRAGGRIILTATEPTVTLTRLQSGIGTLRVEAACSAAVGDLRLGAAYQLRSGPSSTVQLTQGNRTAPLASRRPIFLASHEHYECIVVDLRQCTDIDRVVVYAFSESRAPLNWGGTLVASTFGAAKIELPLEGLQGGAVAVLMSLYNVRGEFVLRAELQTLAGDVRDAARAYGFDRITWLDARTAVD